MAGRNIEEYLILLRMVAEVDPKGFEIIKEYIKNLHDQGEDLKKKAEVISNFIRTAWGYTGTDIARAMKGREEDLRRAAAESKKLADEEKRLAEAEREATGAAQEQGGVLSWLIQKLQEVGTIAAGIIVAKAILWPIQKIREFAGALKEMAKDFVASVGEINATMQLYRAQLTGLLGGVDQAVNALLYAREVGLQMPLVDMPEIVNAIKMLTAFGLNYQKWLLVIGSVSAATGKDIATIVNAIGMIASGSVAYGLYYLRRAGIDLKDFSTEGKSARQVLEELFEILSTRYGQVLPEMVRTWEGSMSTLGKLWFLFREELGKPAFEIASKRLIDFVQTLVDKKDDILAFASVLGEYPARALQRFLSFIDEVAAEIDFKAQDFFRGAVNLGVSFADGLLTVLDSVIMPAVVAIADLIASFLLGFSPPTRGPLSRVYEGAVAVMKTYLLALKEGVDFQTLQEIAGFIQAALSHAVAIGDLPEEQLAGFVIRAREMIARAIGEIGRIGGVTAPTLAELSAFLGPLFADVQTYLGLLAQLKGATDAVAAAQQRLAEAQEWVAEAAEMVRKAQDRLRRFELETAEIPERFTRGRRKQLELAIQQAEEEQRSRQEAVRIAQEQLKATQDQVSAIKEQISLQKAYLSEMERIWKLQEEQTKAQEEGAEGLGDWKKGLKDVVTNMEELKKKWRPILDEIFKDFERLEKHWDRLGDLIKGFLGIKPEWEPPEEWEPSLKGMMERKAVKEWVPSEAWEQGARFKEALEGIAKGFDKITTAVGEAQKAINEFFSLIDVPAMAGIQEGILHAWTITLMAGIGFLVGSLFGGAGAPVGVAIGTAVGELIWRFREKWFEAFDKDISLPFLETLNNWLTQDMKKTVEAGAEEGLKKPLVDTAKAIKKNLVEQSIFPDMLKEIVRLFRELPWKLYPYLYSLYTTIKVWITLASSTWTLEMTKMRRSADDFTQTIWTLVRALERLYELLRLLGLKMPAGVTNLPRGLSQLHAGGPVLRTGEYKLEAGEYVISRERRLLAGIGALGNTYNLGPFIHNWPEGVDRMKRRQLEKIVKKGAFEAVEELMHKSGRD